MNKELIYKELAFWTSLITLILLVAFIFVRGIIAFIVLNFIISTSILIFIAIYMNYNKAWRLFIKNILDKPYYKSVPNLLLFSFYYPYYLFIKGIRRKSKWKLI